MTQLSWRQSWSLRRRLVAGTTVLVLITLLLSATATLFALQASLYSRLDQDVRTGLQLVIGPDSDGRGTGGEIDPGPGQRSGTIEVVYASDDSVVSSTYVSADGTVMSLTATQLATIASALKESGSAAVTVDLGGTLGSFRIASGTLDGATVVSGLSMRNLLETIASLAKILAVVTGVALLAVAGGIAWLVTVALRPLRRVADTAERVSERPLAAGAVALPDRVALSEDPSTEVGRVGTALDALLSHVESALGARQESEDRLRMFIADASHELRTPLASIRGYAQLAQSEGVEMSDIQARSLDRIESEATRMGSLVEDLLLLARLDAGQPILHETVDISVLAIESVEDAHASRADHEWLVEVEEPIEVVGDAHRLRQVLINLLGNAGAHTPVGTRVTTSVSREGDQAVIVVADNGPGVDPQLLPKLFDRFTRGDVARNRESGSTGLGLSIVSAVVHAHGGDINVKSDSSGTTFTVCLPVDMGSDSGLGPR